MKIFVYGTLLDPAFVSRLTGQPAMFQPATLDGWRRVRVRGTPYPTLVRGSGSVDGALLFTGPAGLRRLRAYEGHRYRLTRIRPRVAGSREPVDAFAWIAAGATRAPWP